MAVEEEVEDMEEVTVGDTRTDMEIVMVAEEEDMEEVTEVEEGKRF